MALNNIYTEIQNGAMTLIGNALCVNRYTTSYTPYVYMSTIPTNQVPGYLGNTVSLITDAYSSATLSIPTTCTVKFARLFWCTITNSLTCKLITPDGITQNITEDGHYVLGNGFCSYKDVTNLISTQRSGVYTCGNLTVAGYPGWGMIVAYEDSSLPFRYFNIYMGIDLVTTSAPSPLTFTNFVTPSSGPCKGYLLFAYGLGDLADASSFRVGPTIPNIILGNTSTTVWNGLQPYNKSTNMFPGLTCFADCNNPSLIGLIDSQSTLSTRNINPYAGTYTASGRALWDITGLDISNTLQNSQTELYTKISFAGGGGAYALVQAVQIDMNSAEFSPTKLVDKTTAYPNEELTYSMVLRNTGLLDANNVYVVDTLPAGTSFVSGTLQVNGTTVAGSPLPPGYLVGTVPYGTTTTISYKVTVTTIPAVITPLVNTFSMSYTFTPITIPQTVYDVSNSVTTTVPAPTFIEMHKITNKAFADIGEYITYIFTIPNTGIVDAGNVVFMDTIPISTTYVADSFYLNGTSVPGANPQAGVDLGTIAAGLAATVSFRVQVYTLPTVNPMPNNGTVYFNSYGVTPMAYDSNIVETQVNHARVTMTKTSNSNYADVGSTITYTILLNNDGSTSATNVVFIDTIPNDTTFINGSFSINGTTISGSPNPPGINIGTIPVGVTTVSFKVTVNTLPTPNPILNSAATTFNYTVDPSVPNGGSGSNNSNINDVQVNHARVAMTKISDKNYGDVGSTITYTIVVNNSGNVSATNVIFSDTIPSGTDFVNGTFDVNGVTLAGSPNPPGINLGTIPVGITTVTFQVTVVTIPTINPMPNSATAAFNYTVDPSIPNGGSGSSNSNINDVQVNHARVEMTKLNHIDYADIGTTVIYTIVVNNSGNVSAANVIFSDTIPSGTDFVTGSFSVNGTTIAGSPTPPGVNIGTIPVGITTVSFKVTVNTLPTPNPLINSATTTFNYTVDPSVPNGGSGSSNSNVNNKVQVNHARVEMTKLNDINFADIGTTVTYTVLVNNSGNVSAANVIFSDTIPSGTDFVIGSLSVNGTTIAGSPTPPGVNIGTIPVGITTVSFKVTVNTLPTPNPLINSATTTFNYTVDPSVPNGGSGSSNSNVNNKVQVNHVELVLNKLVDKKYATCSEILKYTIAMTNKGNVSAGNIFFKDTLPNGTQFISNSFTVNGVTIPGANPSTGVNIATISAGTTSTLTFLVSVIC